MSRLILRITVSTWAHACKVYRHDSSSWEILWCRNTLVAIWLRCAFIVIQEKLFRLIYNIIFFLITWFHHAEEENCAACVWLLCNYHLVNTVLVRDSNDIITGGPYLRTQAHFYRDIKRSRSWSSADHSVSVLWVRVLGSIFLQVCTA